MVKTILVIIVAAPLIFLLGIVTTWGPWVVDLGLYSVSNNRALGITGWQIVYTLWPIAAVPVVAAAFLAIVAGWWLGRGISERERSEARAVRDRLAKQELQYRQDHDRARRDALASVQREWDALAAERKQVAAERAGLDAERDSRLEAVRKAEGVLRQREKEIEAEISKRVSGATQRALEAQRAAEARASAAEADRDRARSVAHAWKEKGEKSLAEAQSIAASKEKAAAYIGRRLRDMKNKENASLRLRRKRDVDILSGFQEPRHRPG